MGIITLSKKLLVIGLIVNSIATNEHIVND